MGTFQDLSGKRYNRLLVLERAVEKRGTYWKCLCDCGNTTTVNGYKLKSGHTKSCGCLQKEVREKHINAMRKYDTKNNCLYEVWLSMRARCNQKTNKSYMRYGGRGITVCDEWQDDNGFTNFMEWALNNGYEKGLTIDRIDNSRGYSPDNCRWVDMTVQSNNRENNILVEFNGEKHTLAELCRMYNLKYETMWRRILILGLPFDIAKDMKGAPKVIYKGKTTDLRQFAKFNHIDYKLLLHEVLVEHKDIETILNQQNH